MAETDQPTAQGATDEPVQIPTVSIRAQYIKDLSFENPGRLGDRDQQNAQPNIDLGIDVGAVQHPTLPNMYEVSLKFSAEARAGETVLFILELDYSGIFEFQVDDPLMKERIVFIECPRMLFPFARRVVADVSRDGGFPPLMIDPVDFIALYQQQKARQASAQNGESNSLAAGA